MDEKDQEFNLEDIMKEFGSEATVEEAPLPTEEPADDVTQEPPAEPETTEIGETPATPPAEEVPSQEESTVPAANAMGGDTVRIEVIPDVQGTVRDAVKI